MAHRPGSREAIALLEQRIDAVLASREPAVEALTREQIIAARKEAAALIRRNAREVARVEALWANKVWDDNDMLVDA